MSEIKPVLRQMIDNNKPHWRPETIRGAHKQLDEYEAKAAAFDEVMDLYVNGSNKYLQTKRHTLDVFIEDVAEILKPFTDKYESGEPNELRE